MRTSTAIRRWRLSGLSRNVFWLGVVSFLTDVSSEMTLTVLPLFLANVVGAGPALIGLIEGVAESIASLTKIASGWWSDRTGLRKPLTVAGYTLSAASKPLLVFATSWVPVFAVRLADRTGKGLRSAPRDALIADSSEPAKRGLSFGFHRAADTAGALLGLSLAAMIVFVLQPAAPTLERSTYQTMVLFGMLPGFAAVVVLATFVRERQRAAHTQPAARARTMEFSLRFKLFLGIVFVFTLGNSSDAFILLRAQNLGLSVLDIVMILVAFNVFYTAIATPAGAISDRIGRRRVIIGGWSLYALTYLGFALAGAGWQVWPLMAVYGLYYGMAEGAARALVADLVPPERRGAAYGLFNATVGITVLPASILAGLLWQGAFGWSGFGPSAPFFGGAVLAGLAMLGMLTLLPSTAGAASPRPAT